MDIYIMKEKMIRVSRSINSAEGVGGSLLKQGDLENASGGAQD